jgi:hypothetical protein
MVTACSTERARTTRHRLAWCGPTWCMWIAQADAHTARGVERSEAADGWTVGGKVSTSIVHGPRRTYLTWLRVLAHNEEGR